MKTSSKKLSLSDFSECLKVEKGNYIYDEWGGVKIEWNKIDTVWAKIEAVLPSQGHEKWDFVQHEFLGHYWVWLHQKMPSHTKLRFKWGDKILIAQSEPIDIERKYSLFLGEEINENN